MPDLNPFHSRPFCVVATVVDLLAFVVPVEGLTHLWSLYVLGYTAIAVFRFGWRSLGWPALAMMVMGFFHPAVMPFLIGILLVCVLYAVIVAVVRRRRKRPAKQPRQSSKSDFVSVAVPGGASDVSASDVLARFGMKVR